MFAVHCARDSSGIPRFFIGDIADSPPDNYRDCGSAQKKFKKNEKFAIIQRKFEHHHHAFAGRKRQNVWV